MITINILNYSNPVVDYTYGTAVHGCLHTSAAIVTANNNMAYFESVNSEIKNTEQVQVSVHDHVRDVSVNEDFTWLGTDNDVGGDSAVRAPNPKDRWSLSLSLFEEKLWVNIQFFLYPFQVVFQQFFVESLLGTFSQLMGSLVFDFSWRNFRSSIFRIFDLFD
jgi:hypothetical protein